MVIYGINFDVTNVNICIRRAPVFCVKTKNWPFIAKKLTICGNRLKHLIFRFKIEFFFLVKKLFVVWRIITFFVFEKPYSHI